MQKKIAHLTLLLSLVAFTNLAGNSWAQNTNANNSLSNPEPAGNTQKLDNDASRGRAEKGNTVAPEGAASGSINDTTNTTGATAKDGSNVVQGDAPVAAQGMDANANQNASAGREGAMATGLFIVGLAIAVALIAYFMRNRKSRQAQ